MYLHLHTGEVKCLSGYFTVLSNKLYKKQTEVPRTPFRGRDGDLRTGLDLVCESRIQRCREPCGSGWPQGAKPQLQFLPTLSLV